MEAQELYDTLSSVDTGVCVYTYEKCEELIPTINEINKLKKEKNAIILAHTYVNPEILYGVADYVGDSYYLSDVARKSDADNIYFAAVDFMAETAKLLNPDKKVYKTNRNGGCSLADSITGSEVIALRKKYPEHTFICYINTTAEVKAACDLSVTSSNVYSIVANLETDKIFFLPDRLMALNIIDYLKEHNINKEILYSSGTCYVHESYDPEMIDYLKLQNHNISVAVHPECSPEVIAKADYVGSTSGIYDHVNSSDASAFVLVTECGLSSRIRAESPNKKIIGSCNFCRYMQGNNLDLIKETIVDDSSDMEITLDPALSEKARNCIERMFLEVERN